jgi:hypothetical protein
MLNEIVPAASQEIQRIAVEESRLGIPLLMGRDVIHGYRTIFPIPLGQAAAWEPQLVTDAAIVAAEEAAAAGIAWTFAPMLDVARDPRWGRIARASARTPSREASRGRCAAGTPARSADRRLRSAYGLRCGRGPRTRHPGSQGLLLTSTCRPSRPPWVGAAR